MKSDSSANSVLEAARNGRSTSDSSGEAAARRTGPGFHPRAERSSGRPPSRLLVLAAFAAVYVIWGSTFLAIRYAIQTLPPFLMAASRFLLAGAALTLWARVRGAPRPTRAHLRSAFVVGGLLFLGGNGGIVWAEQYIPSGVAALLVATEPLWIVLLDWARRGGTRPRRGVIAGLLLGLAGVWLLVGSVAPAGAAAGRGLLAASAVMYASVSWAAGSLYSARAPLPSSPPLSAGIQMLAGGVLMAAAGMLLGEWRSFSAGGVSLASAAALLYLIVCGSVVAFTAYSWLLRVVTPARAATYAYVNPLVAVVLGWALAGEELTARMALAALVITASVAIIITGKPPAETLYRHGD